MADKNISVDEILNELSFKRAKELNSNPQSDMQQVNDMIEQLLIEKTNNKLKNENATLNQQERDELEREIKIQTKSITKQFTKQIKKLIREEKAAVKEISSDEELESAFEAINQKQNTQSLKLSQVATQQKVKLSNTDIDKNKNQEKLQKLDLLKQSAHTEHIKREMLDITSHFGAFKASNTSNDDNSKTEITPHNYKEYKKNRIKKIGSFILENNKPDEQPSEQENENANIASLDNQPTDAELQEYAQFEEIVNEKNNVEETSNQENSDDDIYDEDGYVYEYEYVDETEKEEIRDVLSAKIKSSKIAIGALSFLSVLAVLLSLASLLDGSFNVLGFVSFIPMHFVAINMILLILAMIFSSGVFLNSLKSLSHKEPSKDILYSITLIICFTINMLMLFSYEKMLIGGVHLYTPVIVISLLFNYISKLTKYNRAFDNFNYISCDFPKYCAVRIDDYRTSADMTKGIVDDEPVLIKNVKTDFMSRFLSNSMKYDRSDIMCTKLALFILPIAVIAAVAVFFLNKNIYLSMTVLSGVLTLSTTFIGALVVTYPLKDTSDITHHFAQMTPCVEAIEHYKDTNSILIDAYDIFPEGSVVLNGIKTFSGKRIDNAIVDAASVVCQSRSVLSKVFMDIISNNKELLKPVDSIIYEDTMGLSAWVNNKRVLIGNRDLMINHSVAVPKANYEDKYKDTGFELVYLASEGELAAVFIIQIKMKKQVFDVMNLLGRNDVKAIIKTVDSVLTIENLSMLLNMGVDKIKLLPSRLHKAYGDQTAPKEKHDVLIGNNGTMLGFIVSVVTAKKLFSCVKGGVIMNIVGIVLGICGFLAAFFLGKLAMISSFIIILYMLFFGFAYWIYQKNIHL